MALNAGAKVRASQEEIEQKFTEATEGKKSITLDIKKLLRVYRERKKGTINRKWFKLQQNKRTSVESSFVSFKSKGGHSSQGKWIDQVLIKAGIFVNNFTSEAFSSAVFSETTEEDGYIKVKRTKPIYCNQTVVEWTKETGGFFLFLFVHLIFFYNS